MELNNTASSGLRPGFKLALKRLSFFLLIIPPLYWFLLIVDIAGFPIRDISTKELFFGGTYAPGIFMFGLPVYWIALLINFILFIRRSKENPALPAWKLALLWPNVLFFAIPVLYILFSYLPNW